MNQSPTIDELIDGRLFQRVLDTWARMADIVYGDRGPAAGSLMRAHGIKYLTRYLTAGAILAVENNDPEYPWFERWADQAWSTWGTLNGRWLLTDAWPEPEMRLAPFDNIDKHLPKSTRRVTPEERSEILRRRQYYAQRLVGF